VSFDGSNIVFRESFVIASNGKEQLEMPAGSILGINAVCEGTTFILSHGIAGENSMFEIVSRCGRARPR
jgi:hypothetical protein